MRNIQIGQTKGRVVIVTGISSAIEGYRGTWGSLVILFIVIPELHLAGMIAVIHTVTYFDLQCNVLTLILFLAPHNTHKKQHKAKK